MRELRFDLPCTLPVDFEQDVDAVPDPLLDPNTRCRVVVAVHLGAFDKFAVARRRSNSSTLLK
jgi:hypothetical protein